MSIKRKLTPEEITQAIAEFAAKKFSVPVGDVQAVEIDLRVRESWVDPRRTSTSYQGFTVKLKEKRERNITCAHCSTEPETPRSEAVRCTACELLVCKRCKAVSNDTDCIPWMDA